MPIRIAILGGPRCGKTTLIQQLYVDMKIKGLDVGMATEYSTEYLRDKGPIENLAEQYGIYLGQMLLENSLNSFDYALTDYATFVPYIYARFMSGLNGRSDKDIEIVKDLYALALKDIKKYNHIFFVPREFGYTQDGVRWQDEDLAKSVDSTIKGFLNDENVSYTTINGDTKERAKKILQILGFEDETLIKDA